MEKNQYNLCCEVLQRLEREDVLNHVVLIGSWCLLAYKDFFKSKQYSPGIRTRDIDILVPLPHNFGRKVDIEELLKDLDFVTSFNGSDGYMQFVHSDLMLEFLVPERGRGTGKPFVIPDLGINAQPLRFMDFLAGNIIKLKFAGVKISVPHPCHFALLKVIISARRNKPVKKENDIRQAIEVLRALIEAKEGKMLKEVFSSCPKTWQKNIIKILKDEPLTEDFVSIFNQADNHPPSKAHKATEGGF